MEHTCHSRPSTCAQCGFSSNIYNLCLTDSSPGLQSGQSSSSFTVIYLKRKQYSCSVIFHFICAMSQKNNICNKPMGGKYCLQIDFLDQREPQETGSCPDTHQKRGGILQCVEKTCLVVLWNVRVCVCVCARSCACKSFSPSDPVNSSVNNIIFMHLEMSLTRRCTIILGIIKEK